MLEDEALAADKAERRFGSAFVTEISGVDRDADAFSAATAPSCRSPVPCSCCLEVFLLLFHEFIRRNDFSDGIVISFFFSFFVFSLHIVE